MYASNIDQTLVDLGSLTQQDGAFCYLLDGNELTAQGLPSVEAALRHIAEDARV